MSDLADHLAGPPRGFVDAVWALEEAGGLQHATLGLVADVVAGPLRWCVVRIDGRRNVWCSAPRGPNELPELARELMRHRLSPSSVQEVRS
jgi:hypothetical protein